MHQNVCTNNNNLNKSSKLDFRRMRLREAIFLSNTWTSQQTASAVDERPAKGMFLIEGLQQNI
jgi:hypothetical protein